MKNFLFRNPLVMFSVLLTVLSAPSVSVAYLLWDWNGTIALIAAFLVLCIVAGTFLYLVDKFEGEREQ